jgi:hypothetical protein
MNNGPVTWAALGALQERVARLEEKHDLDTEHSRARSNRTWLIVLGILTGLVCPVIVTTILAWLHLHGG